MKRRGFLVASVAAPAICSPGSSPKIRIVLNPADPSASFARISGREESFPVGLGKHGLLPEGESFRGGYSLLGTFEVNAILSENRFEMIEELVSQSGRSREWLARNLFRNMSSIDFDGDGSGAEYGSGFIGLDPVNSAAKQPFHFGEYQGVFRWYSYALHGTQDESRVGKCVTGGCVNLTRKDLEAVLETVQLGDEVEIQAA